MKAPRITMSVHSASALLATAFLLLSLPVRAQTAQELAKYDKNHDGKLDAAETAAMQADQAQVAKAVTTEGVTTLTPFNVDVSKDHGYFAENTLAGSRLNTPLTDLAASITVVTKQQMEDTASLNINDVFRYEANTEGSSTYTPSITDRSTAKDAIGGYSLGNDGSTTTNAQSNRVRGIAAPDAAINYFSTNSRIPFDAYNTQSVEIARGPNSLLFGLGSPAGIVNQTATQAVINRNTNEVQLRTDNYGTFRSSLNVNRSLLHDKLAVAAAMLYDKEEFQRKPSSDLTRRYYGALTYKPFKKTTIRGFAESYMNNANRPNFISPRDFVTPWLQAGRPAYDPISRTVTILNTGQVLGPYTNSTLSPGYVAGAPTGTGQLTTTTSPFYVQAIINDDITRPLERINGLNGQIIDYFQRQPVFTRLGPTFTNPDTAAPTAASLGFVPQDPRYAINDRMWTASANLPIPTTTINGKTYTQATYQFPSATNRGIYDWTKYNILQTNTGKLRAGNYNLEVEQQITDNLFFSAGWFRQDIDSTLNYTLSQLAGATLAIDTNINMPNGQPNPYFGKVWVGELGPDTFFNPETDDNYRAMLAYNLDLTKRGGFLRFLGKHRILGLAQEQDVKAKTERWRTAVIGADADGLLRYTPNPLLNNGYNLWNDQNAARHYYLSSPGSPNATVTNSSGKYSNRGWDKPFTVPINVYNYQTGAFQNDSTTWQTVFSDAGSFTSQREVKSTNVAVQSNLLEDRLITTLGWRHDDYRARKTTTGTINRVDGSVVAPALAQLDMYHTNNGLADYDLIMNRWNRWDKLSGQTKTLGGAFRPLKGWSAIEKIGGGGDSMASEFLQSLTFYYNQSDNFNPPAAFNTDYFAKPLPKPTGKGKDGGIGFNILGNKLVARINWFTTENTSERTAAASTLLTRIAYTDTTTGLPWAKAVVRIRHGANTTVQNWNSEGVNPIDTNATLLGEAWALLGLPVNYYAGTSVAGTQNSKAKGIELQMTYNPAPNWTIKVTGAKQEVIYNKVAPEYDAWLAVRMPHWLAQAAPEIADFTDGQGAQYSLKNFWTGYGFTSVSIINDSAGNTSPSAYFNNVVQNQVALAKALEGVVAPDQRVYHASALTNYVFTNGNLKGWSVGGAERWESRAAVGFLGKAGDPTLPLVLSVSDPTKPVYDKGNYYTDLWVAYSRKIWNDRINLKVQLNVNNVTEGGHLQPTAINFDGTPWNYRIIDPRQFLLTTTFGF